MICMKQRSRKKLGGDHIYCFCTNLECHSGGALPLIFCVHVRSGPIYRGRGYLPLQKGLLGDGILHVNMFHCFKIPYITCTFLTKFTYNEYMGPLICANSETHIQRR